MVRFLKSIGVLVLLAASASLYGAVQPGIVLSESETAWLQDHPVITVHNETAIGIGFSISTFKICCWLNRRFTFLCWKA